MYGEAAIIKGAEASIVATCEIVEVEAVVTFSYTITPTINNINFPDSPKISSGFNRIASRKIPDEVAA